MSEGELCRLEITLFKGSEGSFLTALDEAGIHHSRVEKFSRQPQASGFIESISAISEAMPWNALAKVIVAWIDARKSREVIITSEDKVVLHAKGYSVAEVKKLLPNSVSIYVIDTKPPESD